MPGSPAIDRYVMVRLRHGDREVVAQHLRGVLAAAPEAVAVTVGLPADDTALKWDVAVVVRCADLPALTALLARPEVEAVLGPWLADRAAVVKTWNFAVLPAP
jgi:hypothetical protein